MSGTFKKAVNSFQTGQYGEVIRLLEPQIFRFRDSYEFYYLLGMSCLYTNDIGSSFTYLQRADDLSSRNKDVLLALAIVHLHRRENNEALRCWLHVLEIDPKERKAQKGLSILKSTIKKEELLDNLEEGKLDKLLPVRKKTPKKWPRILLIVLAVALIGAAVPLVIRLINSQREVREDVTLLETGSLEELLDIGGDYYFILTEDEVKSIADKINNYFLDYRDNLAMREINRILLSNTSSDLKDKVALLEDNIRTPGFTEMNDNFTYAEVQAEPFLYRKCFVAWKGRATNIITDEEQIRFELLAGYDEEKVVEGIVTVFLDFAADITPDYPIEVLAEVVPTTAGDFYLQCVAIHRIWD